MIDFALIVPAFNEAARIKNTTEHLVLFFNTNPYWSNKTVTLVLVNDGSTDTTEEIICASTAPTNGRLNIITVSYSNNLGKGGAIQAGIKSLCAKTYGFTDADLAYDPVNLIFMHQKLESGSDCIIGERSPLALEQGYTYFRKAASLFFHHITRYLTGLRFRDTQCGIKVFNQDAAKILLELTHTRFAFDIEFLARLQEENKVIQTHTVNFTKTFSSSITLRDGLRYFLDVLSISIYLNRTRLKKFKT